MIIASTSDTHTLHRKFQIPECNLFIHAGDISDRGEEKTIEDFFQWLEEINAKEKVAIAGNHDFWFQKYGGTNTSVYRKMLADRGIHYLEHRPQVVGGLKVFGTPWTPYFYDWAFNGTDEEEGDTTYGPNLDRLFGQIPDDTDILVTHGPSLGILSKNLRGEECGSKMLRKHLERVQPKIHIHGHIHESYGSQQIEWDSGKITRVFNVSGLQRDYITTNPVTIIEI